MFTIVQVGTTLPGNIIETIVTLMTLSPCQKGKTINNQYYTISLQLFERSGLVGKDKSTAASIYL